MGKRKARRTTSSQHKTDAADATNRRTTSGHGAGDKAPDYIGVVLRAVHARRTMDPELTERSRTEVMHAIEVGPSGCGVVSFGVVLHTAARILAITSGNNLHEELDKAMGPVWLDCDRCILAWDQWTVFVHEWEADRQLSLDVALFSTCSLKVAQDSVLSCLTRLSAHLGCSFDKSWELLQQTLDDRRTAA